MKTFHREDLLCKTFGVVSSIAQSPGHYVHGERRDHLFAEEQINDHVKDVKICSRL